LKNFLKKKKVWMRIFNAKNAGSLRQLKYD
jgi:hypothetical protein